MYVVVYIKTSIIEKWHPHLEELLHMFPVQALQVNQCPSLKKIAEDNEAESIFVSSERLKPSTIFYSLLP